MAATFPKNASRALATVTKHNSVYTLAMSNLPDNRLTPVSALTLQFHAGLGVDVGWPLARANPSFPANRITSRLQFVATGTVTPPLIHTITDALLPVAAPARVDAHRA